MSDRGEVDRTIEGYPDLLPLISPSSPDYAQHNGNVVFGWEQSTAVGATTEFRVSKITYTGSRKLLATFPATTPGWQMAWAWLRMHQPQLAAAVRRRAAADAPKRRARFEATELMRALEAEGLIAALPGAVVLGGYGMAPALSPGAPIDVSFTRSAICLARQGVAVIDETIPYHRVHAIELSGPGRVKEGGGFVGGGFGLLGVAEGMIIASVLNALTTRHSIQTIVRIQAEHLEVFLFTAVATPADLRIQLSEVLARVRQAAAPPPAIEPAPAPAADDLGDRLARLADLFERGLLSPEEFSAAKAKLLS